ncbi:MAG: hypothetical protein ABR550_03380, partial [Wenzhouxiangellaceae bacterium]
SLDTDADLEARRSQWQPRPPAALQGAYARYIAQVSSASQGAVTAFPFSSPAHPYSK